MGGKNGIAKMADLKAAMNLLDHPAK